MSVFINISLVRPNSSVHTILMTPSASNGGDHVMHDTAVVAAANDDLRASYETIIDVQNVVIPLLCLFGVVFNVMAVRILVQRTLRTKSCCMYLTTKCLTDTVFLSALFVVWLDRIEVPWFHRHGVCQIIIFATYVCAFTSVWLVVLVTAENYIRICHPHKVESLCTMGNARVMLVFLGIVAIFCYQFPLWTVHSVEAGNVTRCALIPEYNRFNNALTYFDTAITLVIPLVLVLLLVMAIFHQLWFSFRRNRRMNKLGRQRHTHFMCLSLYGRVTAMLLAVSFTFIVLHTPSHVIRLKLLLSQVVNGGNNYNVHVGIAQLRLQRLFELLYYSSFSINWLTYFSFGTQFRELYKKTFCNCLISPSPAACTCSKKNSGDRSGSGHSGQYILQDGAPLHQNYACVLSLSNLNHAMVEEDVVNTEMALVSTECISVKSDV